MRNVHDFSIWCYFWIKLPKSTMDIFTFFYSHSCLMQLCCTHWHLILVELHITIFCWRDYLRACLGTPACLMSAMRFLRSRFSFTIHILQYGLCRKFVQVRARGIQFEQMLQQKNTFDKGQLILLTHKKMNYFRRRNL